MNSIQKLKYFFERFPGVGPRQAGRFVYHLFNMSSSERKELSKLIAEIENEINRCQSCGRFFRRKTNNQNLCQICVDPQRDTLKLMIVATDQDIKPIESVGFDGVYFVLGGLLMLTRKNKDSISSKELLNKLSQNDFQEVIFALPATSDGDYTIYELKKQIISSLPQYKDRLTLLGRGLATGTEIEYADMDTLKHALKNKERLV